MKCGGHSNWCGDHCDMCARYMDDCDGSDKWQERDGGGEVSEMVVGSVTQLSNEGLDNTIEAIRKANSNPHAYQHMLNMIARDIDAEFCGNDVCSFLVSDFVRAWGQI